MERKLKITNGRQFQTLISELEKNPSLAQGMHRGASTYNFKQDWEDIAIKLNSIGPPIRDSEGWQRVWRDFKFKLKKKLRKYESGEYTNLTLLPLEEATVNLFNTQIKPSSEDEVPLNVKVENFSELEEEEEPFQSTVTTEVQEEREFVSSNRRKRKQARKYEERHDLLDKVFSEISYTMLEVRNVLKESSRYQQKLCEVEEKKLKMLKRRHEREEQLFEADMKLNKIKLELKTKELEILEKKFKNE